LARLVVVSNRVAVPSRDAAKRAGSLEVALRPALHRSGGVWFGWSGKVAPPDALETRRIKHKNVEYVITDLAKDDYQEYYNGFRQPGVVAHPPLPAGPRRVRTA
jgi:trehalose 6-phosphate synthase